MPRKLSNTYILFKLLGESFSFAYTSVKANKLRTFLSLLGVTIGIFSIISVFTMVDALESNIRDGIESLGSDVVYVQRFPWGADDGEYKWWEFRQRPAITYEEYIYLQDHCKSAESMAFLFSFSRVLKYKSTTTSRVGVAGVTYDWDKISAFDIEDGRYFSPMEVNSGSNVALIGNKIAEELFGDDAPVGKSFQIAGHKTRVIGLLKKQGKSLVSANDYDNSLMVPLNYARSIASVRNSDPSIALKSKSEVNFEDMQGEIKTIMRSLRRLKPSQKDNFAINELSSITKQLNPILSTVSATGTITM